MRMQENEADFLNSVLIHDDLIKPINKVTKYTVYNKQRRENILLNLKSNKSFFSLR